MECNKEEAIRAKDIAEKKMQSKDFSGARRIALKAQQLYPDLENISQLLTVCDVHCSAATKINGLEDWYGILQVESTADDVLIKKQYRKLALLLHPDKNKFVGAESAFKLIGEAHRTLSDHLKRSAYDSKRTNFRVTVAQPAVPNTYCGVQPQPATFWTFCPFCKIRYQYYHSVVNRPIRCQTCLRTFVAYELNVNVTANPNSGSSSKQPSFGQQNGFTSQSAFKTKANIFGRASPGTGFHGNAAGRTVNKAAEEKHVHNDPRKKTDVKFEEVKLEKKDEKGQAAKTSTNQAQKRSREKIAPGSKDKQNGIDSSDSEVDVVTKQSNGIARKNAGTGGNKNQRRSNRAKPKVKYDDDQSDDDGLGSEPKKPRNDSKEGVLHDASDVVKRPEVHKSENVIESEDSRSYAGNREDTSEGGSNSKEDTDSASLSYPESEFHDFTLDRDASTFKEGQIWALYDDADGMPRYYAKIAKVLSPGFKVRYTWLEFNPEGQIAKDWYKAKFPVACGNYKLGKTETTTEIGVFSHLTSWEKSGKFFSIKPREGEVWALYKSWDINWLSDPKEHQTYEYEIVKVLSNGVENAGISVVALVKVKGFVSVFTCSANGSATWIPHGEMVRFSHLIPSHRVNVSEIEGIPEGSYELDPASLPCDFEQKFASVTLNVKKVVEPKDPALRVDKCQKAASQAKHEKSEPPLSDSKTNNESTTFHDFQSEKTLNKFKSGQIWALYSDFDTFPKYYGLVTATSDSATKVHVTWLDSCLESEDERKWHDKELPLSTGKFKVSSGKDSREVFDIQAFSHQVDVKETGRKTHFCIYPQPHQIWALYRNWSAHWEVTDMKNCEYDIAEILFATGSVVRVMFLTRVEGCDTIYKPKRKDDMPVISEIPRTEMLRFSHQIPSFPLMGQNKGRFHGYWELDTDSLPESD